MAEMLSFCASFCGVDVTRRYRDIVAEVEHPQTAQHETTLAEAEAFWEQALEDSRRMVEENGGEES